MLDTDPIRFRDMYEVNVFGPVAVIQAFVPLLVTTANRSPSTPMKTTIVNVGSVGACTLPWKGAYGSSKACTTSTEPADITKAAFQAISDVLRREMVNLNVRVITVELGE